MTLPLYDQGVRNNDVGKSIDQLALTTTVISPAVSNFNHIPLAGTTCMGISTSRALNYLLHDMGINNSRVIRI